MNIRPALLDDTARLTFLRQERAVLLQQSNPALIVPVLNFAAAAMNPNCKVFVGERDGVVVGGAVGWSAASPLGNLPKNTGVISDLVLDAHKYHGGLGRLLVEALFNWFICREITQIVALVPRYHPVEQAFWRSLGAAEIQKGEIWASAVDGWTWMKLR